MIRFPRHLYDEIVQHAYRSDQDEACGLLGGEYGDSRSVVEAVHPAENVAEVPEIRYAIDPEEQLALTEDIEARGLEVVGFYHSHPAGGSNPSPTDRERATWPGRSYVIVSLDGYPYVGSWRWRGAEERFEQEIVGIRSAN